MRIFHPLLSLILMLSAALLPAAIAYAQTSSPKVAVFDAPPWVYRDAQGQLTGAVIEPFQRAGKKLGIEFEFIPTSYQRVAMEVLQGRADFTMMSPQPALEGVAQVGEALFVVEYGVVGLQGLQLRSLDDLRGKQVAVRDGATVLRKLQKYPDITLVPVSDHSNAARMLDVGRVQAIGGTRVELQRIWAEMGFSKSLCEMLVLGQIRVMPQVRTASPHAALFPALAAEFKRMKDSGEAVTMLERHAAQSMALER